MIKVQINKICAKLTECEPLTAGMIGKTLEVEFSADWAGLSKTAVFSNGDTVIDVLESQWDGNTITIPHEVLTDPNRIVNFGIYGYTMSGDDIILAIPTKYVPLGRVYVGADPEGDESTEPSLPVYAQLDLRVTDLEEHGGGGIPEAPIDGKQYARQNGAWSEVESGGGSDGVYIVHITLAYGEYHFAFSESWDAIYDALYNSDKAVVAEVWNWDGDDEQYVYSFCGYSDINTAGGRRFVFSRAEGNKTRYLYVHGDNTISAEVVDLDDYALKSDLDELQTGVVACLNDIRTLLSNAAYVDYDATTMLAQLAEDIAELGGGVPEEPITITFDGTKAVISGLGNTTITYSGTTAKIGYMPL